jgi:hypothetical protein
MAPGGTLFAVPHRVQVTVIVVVIRVLRPSAVSLSWRGDAAVLR